MQDFRRNFTIKNTIQAIIGLLIMGFGISMYMITNVGVGSWDVLHLNLAEYYGLTVGYWIFIMGCIVIILSQLIHFNPLRFFSIITGLLMGRFVDLWLFIYNKTGFLDLLDGLFIRWVFFFIAIAALGSGIALLVLSKLPPTPVDVLMLSVIERFRLNFNFAKFLTEAFAFTLAVTIGTLNGSPFNNVGLGTIISLFAVGIVIQFMSKFWKRRLKYQD
jgi:uncharacterized protein